MGKDSKLTLPTGNGGGSKESGCHLIFPRLGTRSSAPGFARLSVYSGEERPSVCGGRRKAIYLDPTDRRGVPLLVGTTQGS